MWTIIRVESRELRSKDSCVYTSCRGIVLSLNWRTTHFRVIRPPLANYRWLYFIYHLAENFSFMETGACAIDFRTPFINVIFLVIWSSFIFITLQNIKPQCVLISSDTAHTMLHVHVYVKTEYLWALLDILK